MADKKLTIKCVELTIKVSYTYWDDTGDLPEMSSEEAEQNLRDILDRSLDECGGYEVVGSEIVTNVVD